MRRLKSYFSATPGPALFALLWMGLPSSLAGQQAPAPRPAPAQQPAGEPAERQSSEVVALGAFSKTCEANYVLDNAGTITTGWINLGQVRWPVRKEQCKEAAKAACSGGQVGLAVKGKLSVYAPVGSANFEAICKAGHINVYFDTQVGGLKKTKDGSCSVPVTCASKLVCSDCPPGHWEEGKWCVTKACSPLQPPPPNNTSFLNTGYFFWDGELRHRVPRSCGTVFTGFLP